MEYSSPWVNTSLDLSIGVNRMQVEDEATESALVEELNRVSAENKKLTEMLTVVCENYKALRKQLMKYVNKNSHINHVAEREISPSKKRKSPARGHEDDVNGVSESSSTEQDELCKKQREETVIKEKVSTVYYQTGASDTTSLVVKDGYQWRKYGQKVTRDNPSPRAYFKCASAPSCRVKKKVQRSMEDQSVLVATYEGEHNHPMPSQMEANAGSNRHVAMATSQSAGNRPEAPITIDLTESEKPRGNSKNQNSRIDLPEVQKLLVEQMASSLTKDPNFTAALAAAVSGRLYQHK